MMTRLSLLAYFIVLTAALLVRNPFAVAGEREDAFHELYDQYVEPVAHFVAFIPLGFLFLASGWPVRRRARLILLAVYAVGTESLQGFIPHRTPQWQDVAQNVAGAAAGVAIWWWIRRRDQGAA